ncbi:hypothetical protein FOL47_008766 [Perkinsus chesapeaki]|uniref:Uncharacterized protein n=1 Tax=Perkinsus chesapeaki TaxID=330153 RepID=A0A7J6MTQ0_PERCH|nr:hypothetical protein FOL47_008766 [Perkinsus chesapeaki]
MDSFNPSRRRPRTPNRYSMTATFTNGTLTLREIASDLATENEALKDSVAIASASIHRREKALICLIKELRSFILPPILKEDTIARRLQLTNSSRHAIRELGGVFRPGEVSPVERCLNQLGQSLRAILKKEISTAMQPLQKRIEELEAEKGSLEESLVKSKNKRERIKAQLMNEIRYNKSSREGYAMDIERTKKVLDKALRELARVSERAQAAEMLNVQLKISQERIEASRVDIATQCEQTVNKADIGTQSEELSDDDTFHEVEFLKEDDASETTRTCRCCNAQKQFLEDTLLKYRLEIEQLRVFLEQRDEELDRYKKRPGISNGEVSRSREDAKIDDITCGSLE